MSKVVHKALYVSNVHIMAFFDALLGLEDISVNGHGLTLFTRQQHTARVTEKDRKVLEYAQTSKS